jgi:hypothetical protein
VNTREVVRFEVSPAWLDYVWGIVASQFVVGPMRWMIPAALVSAAIIYLSTMYQYYTDDVPALVSATFQFTAGIALLLAVTSAGSLALSAWTLRRAGSIMAPATYEISDQKLSVRSPAGQTQTDWSFWRTAVELGPVVIIKSRYAVFHVIPTRQLPTETLRALKNLLRATLHGRVRFAAEGGTK